MFSCVLHMYTPTVYIPTALYQTGTIYKECFVYNGEQVSQDLKDQDN